MFFPDGMCLCEAVANTVITQPEYLEVSGWVVMDTCVLCVILMTLRDPPALSLLLFFHTTAGCPRPHSLAVLHQRACGNRPQKGNSLWTETSPAACCEGSHSIDYSSAHSSLIWHFLEPCSIF